MVALASRRLVAKAWSHSSKSRFNAESLVMRSPTIGSAEFPKTLLGKHSPLGTQHFA